MDDAVRIERQQQTPAQWAVRWHVLVVTALLALAVPVCHLAWHGVAGHTEPLLRTKSFVPAPMASMASLQDGSWMTSMDRHLREASPLTFWWRGTWNETLYRLGAPQSRNVHFGSDGWLYMHHTVWPDPQLLQRRAASRRQLFAAVKQRVEAAGAELLVMIVPDKARVYPEHAYPDGVLSARKAPLYGQLLGELRESGIHTVDLEAAMAAARRTQPELLYKPQDTHWEPFGALAAAQAVARVVEAAPFAHRLPPRQTVVIASQGSAMVVGDLVGMAGFLTLADPGPPPRVVPMSLLTQSFTRPLDYYISGVSTPAGPRGFTGEEADAAILLAGTSFSKGNGAHALRLALGRPIRSVVIEGAGSVAAIREVLELLPTMPQTRLVIWEMVERGFFENDWLDPHL